MRNLPENITKKVDALVRSWDFLHGAWEPLEEGGIKVHGVFLQVPGHLPSFVREVEGGLCLQRYDSSDLRSLPRFRATGSIRERGHLSVSNSSTLRSLSGFPMDFSGAASFSDCTALTDLGVIPMGVNHICFERSPYAILERRTFSGGQEGKLLDPWGVLWSFAEVRKAVGEVWAAGREMLPLWVANGILDHHYWAAISRMRLQAMAA